MWFRSKSLAERLGENKKIKIEGINFTIKRINPIDYLNGSKAMLAIYDKYKVGKAAEAELEGYEKKIKEHLRDVILAGVVSPELSRKAEGEEIHIDEIFMINDLPELLYDAIIEFTYGKKKLKLQS